jgi:hypothetical protein
MILIIEKNPRRRAGSLKKSTKYELRNTRSNLISNTERWVKNDEVRTRRTYESRITTNKVLILDTSYLILHLCTSYNYSGNSVLSNPGTIRSAFL